MIFRPPESVVKNVRSIRLTNLVFLFSSPPLIPSETSCVGPGSTAKEREQGLRPRSLTWNVASREADAQRPWHPPAADAQNGPEFGGNQARKRPLMVGRFPDKLSLQIRPDGFCSHKMPKAPGINPGDQL